MNTVQYPLERLPGTLRAEIAAIAEYTVNSQNRLKVCVVGEFSTGKSSLINALLGAALLPTAREETTALPTFIEYAPELRFELINIDGTSIAISQQQFAEYTVAAPDKALCSVLYYPALWLNGLTLIDLPGLGSHSQRHSEYTHAQICAADTIIYLLSARGATQGDLNTLRRIRQYGKHLMIAVAHWDTVEQSIQDGEQAPDLSEWQAHIAQQTGVDLPLVGVSKHGHGRDAIIGFLLRTQQDIGTIREQRFHAELLPLLRNALGQLKAEQVICEANSVESYNALHAELLNQRQTLLTIKSDLYERGNQDQAQLEQDAQLLTAEQRTQLNSELNDLPEITHSDARQGLIESAYQHLQKKLLAVADALTTLSGSYGQLDLPALDIQQFDLRLPPPAAIELDDFIDSSRLGALQAELAQQQQRGEADQARHNALPVVDLEQSVQKLSALRAGREAIAQQKLPPMTQTSEGNDDCAKLGKSIGEVLDVAFIAFEGPLVIAKALSMLGKGAMVAKTVNTAAKVLDIAQKPELDSILQFTEKLSLSYWGEQLGKRFDQLPSTVVGVDPQAEAEQRRLLQEQDKQIALQRAELRRLEDLQQQRDQTQWALEQNQKEQQRLKANIDTLLEKAAAAHRQAQADSIAQQQALFASYRQQLINQNLINFDQQTRAMIALLRNACKRYWQDHVESTLKQRLHTIDILTEQLQQSPEQKKAALAELQAQQESIEAMLSTLKVNSDVA